MAQGAAAQEKLRTPGQNASRKRMFSEPVPREGEDGLFTQSWFPICLSQEVKPGKAVGRDFLDGRVVVYRTSNGKANVLSAYCSHMGSDLGIGDVENDELVCAFHKWRYDREGACTGTGLGEPAPKRACLFKFPTIEKYGVIFAFNGEEPLWDIPDFPLPEEELSITARYHVPRVPLDPWHVCAQTPDWQHIRAVHRVDFDSEGMYDRIEWTDYTMKYSVAGVYDDGKGPALEWNVGIYGTTMFAMEGTIDGEWVCILNPFGLPRPGLTQIYAIVGMKKGDGSPEREAELAIKHQAIYEFFRVFVGDDEPNFRTVSYRPGTLTKNDKALAHYFDLVRNFPRAHPSADFIK